ncbi:hypothetical protein Droror1_Dr00018557 [Drosera rotundifolia]
MACIRLYLGVKLCKSICNGADFPVFFSKAQFFPTKSSFFRHSDTCKNIGNFQQTGLETGQSQIQIQQPDSPTTSLSLAFNPLNPSHTAAHLIDSNLVYQTLKIHCSLIPI